MGTTFHCGDGGDCVLHAGNCGDGGDCVLHAGIGNTSGEIYLYSTYNKTLAPKITSLECATCGGPLPIPSEGYSRCTHCGIINMINI